MTSIFMRPPRAAASISAQFAEIPVRTDTELFNAIGAISARGAAGAVPALGGSILICAPIQLTKSIIIPETCPGLSIRAAAKFPITPIAGLILPTLFDVRAEFFTVRDLFVYAATDPVTGFFNSYFTTFVTISAGASAGRSRIRPALLDNDVFCDQIYKDVSVRLAAQAQIARNRSTNVTTTSTAAVIAIDSIRARVVDNVMQRVATTIDGVNISGNADSAAVIGNELGGMKITTVASSGHSSIVGNTNCGTITLGNVSDVQSGNT